MRSAERTKILHIHGEREDIGGILSVIRNLDSQGSRTGCEHEVLQNSVYRESRKPGLAYRFNRYLVAESTNHFALFLGAFLGAWGIKNEIKTGSFDIVHGHSRGALLVCSWLAMLGHIPVVFTNHAFANRIWLYRWAAHRTGMSTVVLTPSMAAHYGFDANGGKIHVVSECCHDRFFGLPLVQRHALEGRTIKLVGLGSITHGKKWHLGLQAISMLTADERKRIQLDVWGPVHQKKSSQQYYQEQLNYINTHGLNECCRFHPPVQNVEEPLSESDYFFLPRTDEPCSVALIESLSMGLPAIVSRSGGNVDIVEHDRTGLLFQPDDPYALRDELRRVLRGQFDAALSVDIRRSVRERSATEVAKRYAKIYHSISKNGG